jgi:IclR family pca regulon transcriptional regulator
VAVCDGRFRLLPRVLDLGYPLLSGLTLGELAQPHLSALAARLHHSASMAVLDGPDIRYVARAAAGRIMRVSISVGTRFPAHATSMGRVLLAGLPPEERAARLAAADLAPLTDRTVTDPSHLAAILDRVARDGYAHVTEELENGLQSLAVPVHDRDGHVVAAVNVALHASPSEPPPATVLPALRDTATRITADTAASFTPPPA